MIHIEKDSANYLWPVFTAIIVFCIGYIHHRWFFPFEFDGDAASMHVLAKAILDEGSLLPADFNYGNQVVFLRSSPFIALASLVGFTDYKAFVFGSSLSIAFWGVVLYLFLSAYFNSNTKGFFFSILLLLPLGNWDSDFVLGQQSHLSNAILSLGTVVSIWLYITNKSKLFLIAACVCLFTMSSEAPIRGLLILAPILISLVLISGLKKTILAALPIGLTFILAYFANKLLINIRPISWNFFNTIIFKSSNQILDNLITTTRETLGGISSLNIIAGEPLSVLGFFVLAAALLLTAGYLGFVFFGLLNTTKMVATKQQIPLRIQNITNGDRLCLVQLTAVFGLIVGSLAVATLNPDSSRHYLWAIFLAKLFVFKWLYNIASEFVTKKMAAILVLTLGLLMSSWFAYLVKFNWDPDKAIKSKSIAEAIQDIKEISDKTGIKNIYGENFWRMMPLNTLISNMNSQALVLANGGLHIFSWLTRPSWSCAKGDALYYLKSGSVDEAIKERLIDAGGNQVKDGNGYSLWVGPRVWQVPSNAGCYESSLVYGGKSFANLPAAVGVLQKNTKKTDGKAGFLVFGPYASLGAGDYELNLYGFSDFVGSAYLDVVSNKGRMVHGRFVVGKDVNGELLHKAAVHLPANVADIEVRVWVGEHDSLELVGYSLKPYPRK
ncbi:hypothetical protein PT7_3182 [Pusillimonas sp. T7-7]|uniref:hypothetical protein n=1 Tax=Pusillimonas sp. (strain T7-7) TaxID=1007105 RepID=UPI0002084CF6|nr:hypothetical protein [Pusillimonas sp. T7-7]AEC21722.1 hypothetical protein PT7_3182 [Pusillimonas sp. T7-7]